MARASDSLSKIAATLLSDTSPVTEDRMLMIASGASLGALVGHARTRMPGLMVAETVTERR